MAVNLFTTVNTYMAVNTELFTVLDIKIHFPRKEKYKPYFWLNKSSRDAPDKPAKRGKKPEQKSEKEGPSSKVAMPEKRNSEQAAPSALKKRIKKKAHKPKVPSLSDYDYVPSDQQSEPESSDNDTSQHDSSLRGNSPPP